MADFFREVQSLVSAQNAARHYRLPLNRKGLALCPFHPDKHPSMSFHKGRFRCWSCGAAGDSIDLTSHLFNLTPLEAVRKMNEDFSLGLPIDKPITPSERQEAEEQERKRRDQSNTWELFKGWREQTIRSLNTVFRIAHLALNRMETAEDLDKLTDSEAEAIRWQRWAEHVSDTLAEGNIRQQMEVFRGRRGVEERCSRVLNDTHEKSKIV